MKIEVRLFANLRCYLPPAGDKSKAVLDVPDGTRLRDVIGRLNIPTQLAQLVMVDGVHETNRERILHDGAVVSIFPPVAGGGRPAIEPLRPTTSAFVEGYFGAS